MEKAKSNYLTHFEMFLLTEKRVAKNTYAAYKRDIEQFLQFLNENKITLEKCGKPQLKKFLRAMKNKGVTAKTLSRKISSLKLFFSFLNDKFKMPNRAATLAFPKVEKTLPVYLTEQELQCVFDIANKDTSYRGIRNKVMLSLLYASGMRVSELVSMKINQLNFETGFVTVYGKGGKERDVPLPQNALDLLKFYLNTVYDKLLPKEKDPYIAAQNAAQENKGERYLFPVRYQKKTKPISRQLFWVIVKKIIAEADIQKNISPHSLRHSLATHLLKKGANIRFLQALLGHERLTTVQVYTHLEKSQLRKEYDKKHPRA